MCRNRPSVIARITSSRSSSGAQVCTTSVMIAADGVVDDGAVTVHAAYDVALAHDAVERTAVGADDEGADVVLGESLDELAHAGVRGDRDDFLVLLGLEDLD